MAFAACSAAPSASVTAAGKIVFVRTGARPSEAQDAGDILVVNPDGSGERSLTNGPADDGGPSWSADARSIVFTRYPCKGCNGQDTLFVMSANGTGVRRLTRLHGTITPTWSPRGGRIAFARFVRANY